jgi:hypothetical protein
MTSADESDGLAPSHRKSFSITFMHYATGFVTLDLKYLQVLAWEFKPGPCAFPRKNRSANLATFLFCKRRLTSAGYLSRAR